MVADIADILNNRWVGTCIVPTLFFTSFTHLFVAMSVDVSETYIGRQGTTSGTEKEKYFLWKNRKTYSTQADSLIVYPTINHLNLLENLFGHLHGLPIGQSCREEAVTILFPILLWYTHGVLNPYILGLIISYWFLQKVSTVCYRDTWSRIAGRKEWFLFKKDYCWRFKCTIFKRI